MATVTDTNVEATTKPADAAVRPLNFVLSNRLVLHWQHVLLCGALAAFFVYLSYVPLFHTDIWCHVHYGQWIVEHGALPQEDPFLPLAEGVPVVDNAWASQVILAEAESLGGPFGLSCIYALTVFATYLVYTRVFYLLSGRPLIALAGFFLLFFVAFSRHAIIRPEIFGGLLLGVLLWMIVRVEPWRSRAAGFRRESTGDEWPWWFWLCTPLLFACWANMHGSFAIGLIVLACHAAGSAVETLWQTRNPLAIFRNRSCWRWILLTELAAVATLLNPYGFELLVQTALFGSNPNLRDVMEWYPLKLIDLEGIQFCIAIVLMIVLLRHSRLKMRATDVLLLLLFGFAVAPTIRMIGWFAPIFTLAMIPHLTNICSRVWPAKSPVLQEANVEPRQQSILRFAGTFACVMLVWCAFAVAPISQPLLGGTPRPEESFYSKDTPHGVTKYLREHPPEGLVFAPQWWGDWLCWAGPPDLKVFMTTTLHLAPAQVWRDYLRVARGEPGWERALDKYHVKTLVVHKELQVPLARNIRSTRLWRKVYEDDKGVVLERVEST